MIYFSFQPSNIFFSNDETNTIKVGDFGLVTSMVDEDESIYNIGNTTGTSAPGSCNNSANGSTPRQHTLKAGTAIYMSPEQRNGVVEYDAKVDIFALGLIFFEMLWYMQTMQERVRTLENLRALKFPAGFATSHPDEHALLLEMLNSDPKLRPTTKGIRVKQPIRELERPSALANILPEEHYTLIVRRQSQPGGSRHVRNFSNPEQENKKLIDAH